VVPGPTPPHLERRAVAAGLAAALIELAAGRGRAGADPALDVQVLQTAASMENLLITTYEALLLLPLVTGSSANPVLKTFFTTARNQHIEHGIACNELATKLGGRAQPGSNPGLASIATRARSAGDLAQVVDLALQLETACADTHQNAVGLLGDLNARRLVASILGVEAQHRGLLLVAKALVDNRMPDLVGLDPAVVDRLPPEAPLAGFPDTFSKADQARPATEGALR
jgi:hypothetical protein